eukprot:GCRY01001823.1.p1 GENE.GCRY01001823.1~~GCRY01001823.1.p1  ORF type:complete len:538 (-),score=153.48 GCRY01001823.1:748-2361(-)
MPTLTLKIVEAVNLEVADKRANSSDPYVVIKLKEERKQTKVVKKCVNPVWNEEFVFKPWKNCKDNLEFFVFDKDSFKKDDPLGSCSLNVAQIAAGWTGDLWLTLEAVTSGKIHVHITYVNAEGVSVEQCDEAKQAAQNNQEAPQAEPQVETKGILSKMKKALKRPFATKDDDDADWRNTNVGLIGSDADLEQRIKAAATEEAWEGAGEAPGLEIWRIEKFQVVPWKHNPQSEFYSGDSYIILKTYKEGGSDKLKYDIHFWLGGASTQDERGTAAYKTVELDDLLGCEPVQHREVMGYESPLFLGYFQPPLRTLEGGVESGFNHVEPEEYRPRLLHIKGKKRLRIVEVPLKITSLNHGDSFVLDNGLQIFQWSGRGCGIFEKQKANELSHALRDERGARPELTVLDDDGHEPAEFTALLAQDGAIQEKDNDDDIFEQEYERALFRLSDSSGKLVFSEEASGDAISMANLDSKDVFILDTGAEIFVWVGSKSSKQERKNAMSAAMKYIKDNNRPAYLSVTRVIEGGENQVFRSAMTASV